MMTHALHLLGDIATYTDRFDAETGETHYRQALALAEPRGMRPLVAHCNLGLGKLYRGTGKPQEAQDPPHHRGDDVPGVFEYAAKVLPSPNISAMLRRCRRSPIRGGIGK